MVTLIALSRRLTAVVLLACPGGGLAGMRGETPARDAAVMSWTPIPLPTVAGYSGPPILFQRDRTGWLTQPMIDANQNTWHWDSGYGAYPWRCLVMASPDESAAFRHSVDVGDYVLHVGHRVSWPRVNTFRAALLRYRFYATAWAGQGGKLIMFEGGRGWIGDGWHYPADDDHGTDGWTENSMHDLLKGTTQNRFALYVSHEDLGPPEGGRGSFGSSGDKLAEAWPLHRWITVDILVDMERGYQLFQDGVEVARRFGARPPRRSAEDCRTLGMTVRLMHGGNPHPTMPVRDYEEYFKDFEIFIYE